MESRDEYFFTIASMGNLSAAAEKLYVSQPYLSQYITRLENELDVKLFDRSKTPIILTPAGEIYAAYLEKQKDNKEKLVRALSAVKNSTPPLLRLGFGPWRGAAMLPEILPDFYKEFPDVELVIHEYLINETTSLLKRGKIDISVVNPSKIESDGVISETIYEEKILLVADLHNPHTHDLINAVKCGDHNPLLKIKNDRFILLSRGLIAAEKVHNYFCMLNFEPKERLFLTNTNTAVNLVSKNLGFAFMLETGIPSAAVHNNLVFIDLGVPELQVSLNALYRRTPPLTYIGRRFIDFLKIKLSKNNVRDRYIKANRLITYTSQPVV